MKSLSEYILEDLEEYPGFRIEVHKHTDPGYTDYMNTHASVIWKLLEKAYAGIGGFHGLRSEKALKKKIKIVKEAYYKETLVAVSVYNDHIPVYKCVGVAAVQGPLHRQGVVGVKLLMRHDAVNWNEYTFIEVDLDMEQICKEVGAFNLPAEYAIEILKPGLSVWEDGYHYNRYFTPIKRFVTKTIFGIPTQEILDKIKQDYSVYFKKFLDELESRKVIINYSKFNESKRDLHKVSVIDCARKIVNAFINNLEDRGVYEYTNELIERLRQNLKILKSEYAHGNYDKKYEYLYPRAIEEGEEILSIVKPFRLHIIEFD